MIDDFLLSWALFHNTYIVGWEIGALLALTGVLVVARDQIFIGAAVSQASTLGIAAAMALGAALHAHEALPWMESDLFLSTAAVLSSIAAAGLTSFGGGTGRESHEAITGWVFLVSASLSILIVAKSPHGLEEVHRLVASSIIGATEADAWTFGALLGAAAAVAAAANRRILLFAMDPPMAAACGMRIGVWSAATSLWLGLCIGLSIRVAGMLFAFGFLVLPALVAKGICREVRPMFAVAPLVALLSSAAAFVLANAWDVPPAQMAVGLLCGFVALAWAVRRLRA